MGDDAALGAWMLGAWMEAMFADDVACSREVRA